MIPLAGLIPPDLLLAHAFVFLRVAAMVALVPAFGEQSVPPRMRLAAALALATVIAPAAVPGVQRALAGTDPWSVGAGEIAAGFILGLSLRLMVHALQIAGTIAAQAASLSQLFGGTAIDPLPTIGHILTLGGLAIAAASGLHVELALALIATYDVFPAGARIDAGDAAFWSIERTSGAIALAFSLALPFVIAATLYNLALGVLNRAMPQFMATFIGVPALTWAVLALMALSMPFILGLWADALFRLLAAGGVSLP
ncbi:MAG: flagellar biosynthetic protein FliR [Rhodobacteraceae bacterium]|jgi:flagellar biosynthetic protein FliR|nr:flagellar biosynthetic protein FliR [Paracoccaceae bacterium]